MSLQDILKKILDQAQAQVKEIEKETEEKKQVLGKESQVIEKQEQQDLEKRTTDALESVEIKATSMARRDSAKELSHIKKELVDEAMKKLVAHLNALDDKQYTDVVNALITQISESNGTIEVPKGKSSLVQSGNYEVKESDSVSGGFIFRNDQVVIDNSFESLVFSQFHSELEIYFAEQLKLV